MTTQETRVEKPWGYYVDHLRSKECVQKTIYVAPNRKLSLQYHALRGEFWYVEKGYPVVTLEKKKIGASPGYTVEIEPGTIHRIENLTDEWVVIHEMQYGLCFEDDIIRLEDDYNRTS